MANRGPNPREDLRVAQGPATERLAPVSSGGNSSGFDLHEIFSNNSHSSASFGISLMQQQQQPQGLSATAAPQLHPLFGGESGLVCVPPGPVKEPSLVQFEDLDMIQDYGDAFAVAPQATQGTVTNYLGSGTANSYPQPITSNLTPQMGVESSPSVQLFPIQQPYPQSELGAATGTPPTASFPESQWTNNPNLHQPEYSLVSSAPGHNSNFQLQSQSPNDLGYNSNLESQTQLSTGLLGVSNPNLQLQSQSSNGLEYNPNLESQTQLSTGLGNNPNLQPQFQSSSGLGCNFNFQPSHSSNGLGYNPITLESSQSQLSASLGQNHNLEQQSQSSNGLGYPNLQPESQTSNLELQSQISIGGQGHNSNLQPQSQSSSGLGYDSNFRLQSQISTCLGHNPNLDSQFQSSNGQGYNPNLQPQAQISNFLGYNSNVQPQPQSTNGPEYNLNLPPQSQISNFLGYNSNVQPQPQSTNGPEYNPNLQQQSQLSTGSVYCDPNVQQSSTGMGVSQEMIQSPGLSGSYPAGWPSNYQNQSPNIEQQALFGMQFTPNQPHQMVPSSSNVVMTTTLQDRNKQQSTPFQMGTGFPSQAAQGFQNLQPQAPRRFVPSQIYDSSFEEMGLPIDPHLRLFRRRNL